MPWAAISAVSSAVAAGSSLFGGSGKSSGYPVSAIAAQLAQQARATADAKAGLNQYAQTGGDALSQLALRMGVQSAPVEPAKSDYYYTSYVKNKKRVVPVQVFNQQAYDQAMADYNRHTEAYNQLKESGQLGDLNRNFSMEDYQQDPGYTPMVNSLEELQNTPGYQFQLEQGLQAANNSAAAKGGLMSGAALKEAERFGQGLASTGFQDAWNRAQSAYQSAFARDTSNKTNTFNRLFSMAGSGQNAASGQGAFGMQGAAQIGSGLTAFANNSANYGLRQQQNQQNMMGGVNQAIQGGLSNYMFGNLMGGGNSGGSGGSGFGGISSGGFNSASLYDIPASMSNYWD